MLNALRKLGAGVSEYARATVSKPGNHFNAQRRASEGLASNERVDGESRMTNELINAASKARELAYAPYSHYAVGAAVMGKNGQIWTGANVENVSYPVGICAERAAITKMVNEGETELTALAVVTQDGGTPCGMCLQFMSEFAAQPSEVQVFVLDGMGQVVPYTLEQLLPHGFKGNNSPNNQ